MGNILRKLSLILLVGLVPSWCQQPALHPSLVLLPPDGNPPEPSPQPLPQASNPNCTYPTGAAYFGNLQGRIPTNCYSGNLSWWALPINGGTLAVNAEACKTNVWYVSVKGEKLNSYYSKEARVAGIQGLTGTPENPVTKNPALPLFDSGTCSGSYSPFHGVKINSNGLPNFSYSGPLQSSPDSAGQYDPCQLGVYRIEFTPSRSDVGKTFSVKVTGQILVTNFEFSNNIVRESSQIDWNVNITVAIGTACPTIAVNVSPATKIIPFGASYKFTAGVSGTSDTRVQWKTAGGGTIDQTGNYTAGSNAFTDTVTATSIYDPSKSGNASVVVRANQVPIFMTALGFFNSSALAAGPCYSAVNPTPVNYQYVASDPDGYSVVYSLSPASGYSVPTNVSMNSTGRLQWDGKLSTGFVLISGSVRIGHIYECHLMISASDPHGGVAQYPVILQFFAPPIPDCAPPPNSPA